MTIQTIRGQIWVIKGNRIEDGPYCTVREAQDAHPDAILSSPIQHFADVYQESMVEASMERGCTCPGYCLLHACAVGTGWMKPLYAAEQESEGVIQPREVL